MNTRLPLAQRRAHLVQAALTVAVREGIAATTVRRVAEQAGVALGVVHYCFDDKDELFIALAARIVDDLASAATHALATDDDPPDLRTALHTAVSALWDVVETSSGAQLLTYEITAHALRNQGLHIVAVRQYEVSQAAAEQLLKLAAGATGAKWSRPVADLAGEALAFVDGVTLRWLVDGDGTAARARLTAFTGYLATQIRPRRPTARVAVAASGRVGGDRPRNRGAR